jgi:hypothetical protein
MERQRNPGITLPHYAEFIIGPAHPVRPLAGPMASSGLTRWLHTAYK